MQENETPTKELPFNNLFLNSGLVHGYNQLWMYVFGIGATLLGYITFQLMFGFALMSRLIQNGYDLATLQAKPELLLDPHTTGVDKNIMLALLLGMFCFALLGLFLVIRRVHKKTFLSVITGYNTFRYKRFFTALAIWGAMVLTITLIGYFSDPSAVQIQFEPAKFIVLFIICILLMPIQTGTEEIFIRGYLMQGFSQIFKNAWMPLIITSAIFGFMHMENPEAKNYGWSIMFPYYTFFGLFLGVLALIDEGLELPMGIHFANNCVSSLLVTTPRGTLQTDAIFLVQEMDPVQEFIAAVVMCIVTFIIFWLIYRWKNFNLIIK